MSHRACPGMLGLIDPVDRLIVRFSSDADIARQVTNARIIIIIIINSPM